MEKINERVERYEYDKSTITMQCLLLHQNNFQIMLFWLIWLFKCLILMILTMAKYHENLLRDSTLCLLFIAKSFSSLEIKVILKMPNEIF